MIRGIHLLLLATTALWVASADHSWAVQARIASFNVELGVEAPGTDAYNSTKQVLARVDADIVGLVEVTAGTLTNMHQMGQELGYPYRTNAPYSSLDPYNRISIMSRYPFISVDAVRSPVANNVTNNEMTRLPLAVKVDVPGTDNDPTLIVVHYKCCDEFFPQDRFRRAVEIRRTIEYIANKLPNSNSNVFVIGDYNLVGGATTITSAPTNLPTSYRLGADITSPISYSTDPNFYFSPYGLNKVTMFQADGTNKATFGTSTVLDYIVTSSAVIARGYKTEIYNSAKDTTDYPGLPKAGNPLPASTSANASDHYLVFGDFLMDTTLIPALVLNSSPSTAAENAAANTFNFTVRIPEAPGAGETLTVNLANNDPSELALSATNVTFTEGVTAIDVFGSPLTDGIMDGNQVVTVRASAEGYSSASTQVTVTDVDFVPGSPVAAIALDASGRYLQDFNTLPNTGTNNVWTNGLTLPGWYAARSGTGDTLRAGTGSGTSSDLYSFGPTSNNDRALGSIGGSTMKDFAYGVQFRNSSPNSIWVTSIAYTGEQWRVGATNVSQSVNFFYRKSPNELSNASPGTNDAGWTAVAGLDFTSPTSSAVGLLDGNQPTNRMSLSNSTDIILQPGEYIMLRWSDTDHSGFDHGLAIDDLAVTWAPVTAAPAIEAIGNQTMDEDKTLILPVNLSDADTPLDKVVLSATSSNSGLLPDSDITISGSGASQSVLMAPTQDANGTTTVTVTASDGTNSTQRSFTLTVNPVNDPPYISDIEDIFFSSYGNQASAVFVVSDPDSMNISVTATSSDTGFLPDSGLVLGDVGDARTVSITPAPGIRGSSIVTISASDGAATTQKTFNAVRPDTSPPVITLNGTNPLTLPVGAVYSEAGATASDAVDGQVTVQISGSVNTGIRGSYTVTYFATDASGNSVNATRTVTVRALAAHIFETQFGLSGEGAALTADPDNDGVPNIIEYALQGNPTNGAAVPSATLPNIAAGKLRLTAVVRTNDSELNIYPMTTGDLRSAWSTNGVSEIGGIDQAGVDTGGGFRRRTWQVDNPQQSGQFMRLQLSYP